MKKIEIRRCNHAQEIENLKTALRAAEARAALHAVQQDIAERRLNEETDRYLGRGAQVERLVHLMEEAIQHLRDLYLRHP